MAVLFMDGDPFPTGLIHPNTPVENIPEWATFIRINSGVDQRATALIEHADTGDRYEIQLEYSMDGETLTIPSHQFIERVKTVEELECEKLKAEIRKINLVEQPFMQIESTHLPSIEGVDSNPNRSALSCFMECFGYGSTGAVAIVVLFKILTHLPK